MTGINKYTLFSIGVVTFFLYMLVTEIYDRADNLIARYEQIEQQKKTVLSPDEFSYRKKELQVEKQELTTWAMRNYSAVQQNQGGLFEYLNISAKQNNVVVRSINPQEGKKTGSVKIVPFTMNIKGSFHNTAKFINTIESGQIPLLVVKTVMKSEPIGNSILNITLTGQARLLSEAQ